MRVGVYDEWWPTAGGGEKFAAGIAQALADEHEVVLLSHAPLDTGALGERLQLDLSRVGVEVIDVGQGSVEDASAAVELFVNASYMSRACCRAEHGLYVVHFPNPPTYPPSTPRERVKQVLRPLVGSPGLEVAPRSGFHPDELVGGRRCRWTTGEGVVAVSVPPGRTETLTIVLGRDVGVTRGRVPVALELDGRTVLRTAVAARTSPLRSSTVELRLPIEGSEDPHQVTIRSESVVPLAEGSGPDDRRLGVPVLGLQLGSGPAARFRRRHPSLGARPSGSERAWIDTYDQVASNSRYTQTWVRRWWDIDTGVLHPPVTLQQRAAKEQMILNVGRFFASEHGHSKKQLDLVRAMRALCWRGRVPGWTLHLVGGCSAADESYLDKVRAEAEGLPVVIHANAPGSLVRDLYARAAIYWHATGLGEDPDTQPDRFEHFGITTVEAMSAGAVPVVIMAAGQEEVVTHGITGMLWEPLVQLVCFTEDLVLDPDRLGRMADAAADAAQDYGLDAFGRRVRALVADMEGD